MTYFERITDPTLLTIFVFLCAVSFFFSVFFMIAARFFVNRRAEQDFYAIQNAHDGIVSRLGGLAVFLTFILFLWALNLKFQNQYF